jgi:hypothetical protein
MKKVFIFTAVLFAALIALAITPAANADNPLPEFVQQCIDSCGGQPIAWGDVSYKGLEGTDIWFCFKNSDEHVSIWINGIVPSDLRQNLQAIKSDVKGVGWGTKIDNARPRTMIGTANFNKLCGDDVCTNKKAIKGIQDKTKDTGLTLTVKDYFD